MKSKWFELKDKAIKLRRQGISVSKIESRLNIPRSTLSGWFKNIKLSEKQKAKLIQDKNSALARARMKAIIWHHKEKCKRLKEAEKQAKKTIKGIDTKNKNILELVLAILYLGEGAKTDTDTSLGSSDPMILKFFLAILKSTYNIKYEKMYCQLNLRADQNPQEIKEFWSKQLNIPIEKFKYFSIDRRTRGKKTYSYYKGVCQIRFNNVAIQRKLLSISNIFCHKVIKQNLDG